MTSCNFTKHIKAANYSRRIVTYSLTALELTRFNTVPQNPIHFIMAVAGSYEMVSSENYDEYLKAVGVGVIKRGLAKTATPTMTFTENNGKWTQKTTTAIKTFEITFTPGVEFDEETADGRTVKATITFEGNKLVHKQKDGKIEATTVREFNGDEMITTFSSNGVTAVRKFKKV